MDVSSTLSFQSCREMRIAVFNIHKFVKSLLERYIFSIRFSPFSKKVRISFLETWSYSVSLFHIPLTLPARYGAKGARRAAPPQSPLYFPLPKNVSISSDVNEGAFARSSFPSSNGRSRFKKSQRHEDMIIYGSYYLFIEYNAR